MHAAHGLIVETEVRRRELANLDDSLGEGFLTKVLFAFENLKY
jgi:hypothetical protein